MGAQKDGKEKKKKGIDQWVCLKKRKENDC